MVASLFFFEMSEDDDMRISLSEIEDHKHTAANLIGANFAAISHWSTDFMVIEHISVNGCGN